VKLGLDASEVEDLWKKDWKGQGFACRTWRTRDTIFFLILVLQIESMQ